MSKACARTGWREPRHPPLAAIVRRPRGAVVPALLLHAVRSPEQRDAENIILPARSTMLGGALLNRPSKGHGFLCDTLCHCRNAAWCCSRIDRRRWCMEALFRDAWRAQVSGWQKGPCDTNIHPRCSSIWLKSCKAMGASDSCINLERFPTSGQVVQFEPPVRE